MSVNNKKNKVVFTSNQKMCNFVSRMGMYLLLILVPLWMNKDMYTAMIGAKGKCVIFCFALMLLGIAVCYIYGFAVRERHIKFSVKNWEPMDYAVLAFGISIFLSFLGSSDKAACLTGSQGFHCGTFMCLSGIAFYFFLSRNMIPERSMWDMVFIVSDIIFAWVFCNSISFDILNMHAMIAEYQYFSYYGPLGNSNSISAYLCLLLPVGVVFFMNEKHKNNKLFYGVYVFLCVLAILAIHTEGVMIGIAVCMIFMIIYGFSSGERFIKFMEVGALAGGAMLFTSVLSVFFSERMHFSGSIASFIIKKWIGAALLLICLLLLFLYSKWRKNVQDKVLNIISYIMSGGIVAGIIVYIVYVANNFSYEYGSGRGAIWAGSIDMFKGYSVKEKLIGLGTEMIKHRLTPIVAQLSGNNNLNYANCHNNILECILCLGIIGFIAYIAVWVCVILPFFKKSRIEWSAERMAYTLSLIAYLGQSAVGNPYSLSAPMVFLFLGLLRNCIWVAKNQNRI